MSTESDPFAEFYGVDPWADEEEPETSTGIDYPDPLQGEGRVVKCPLCSWGGVDTGYWTHFRREHTDREW